MKRTVSLLVTVTFLTTFAVLPGCGSEYTILDRSTLVISDNARVSASSVLPGGQRNPRAVTHLALAQEVYQKQLDLLKERRNKVRARRRTLSLLSFGALLATGIVVGSVALAGGSSENERQVGAAAMGGVGLGTGLQIGGLMQEDVATIDDKVRHLSAIYDAMVERVRTLGLQPPSAEVDAATGAAIEGFINDALQINVKG